MGMERTRDAVERALAVSDRLYEKGEGRSDPSWFQACVTVAPGTTATSQKSEATVGEENEAFLMLLRAHCGLLLCRRGKPAHCTLWPLHTVACLGWRGKPAHCLLTLIHLMTVLATVTAGHICSSIEPCIRLPDSMLAPEGTAGTSLLRGIPGLSWMTWKAEAGSSGVLTYSYGWELGLTIYLEPPFLTVHSSACGVNLGSHTAW